MENNLPVISKRVGNIVRVLFFMFRKGFTKPKLLMDLNLMLKRPGKLAGKAIASLISHHHHHHRHHENGTSAVPHDSPLQFSTPRDYEFSCSNTPNYGFFSKRRYPRHLFACAHAPPTPDHDAAALDNALKVALEMLDDKKGKGVLEASPPPALSGSTSAWQTRRMVRQVRITDSPFPVQDGNDDGDHQVDREAEEFITRFYKELKKQG